MSSTLDLDYITGVGPGPGPQPAPAQPQALDLDYVTGIADTSAAPVGPANRPIPSLLAGGAPEAERQYIGGQIQLPDLIQNTGRELAQRYGAQNVREERNKGGVFDYSVRLPGGEWKPLGARQELTRLMLAKQQALMQGADIESGLPWAPRAELSFKSERGKRENLIAHYGKSNVWEMLDQEGKPTGDFLVKPDAGGHWTMVDPNALNNPWKMTLRETAKDATADIAGDLVEAIPGAVFSAAGTALGARSPIGAMRGGHVAGAIGDALGTITKHAIGHMFPGDENETTTDVLADALTNVAAGQAGELAGRGIRRAYRYANPKTRFLQDVAKQPVAQSKEEFTQRIEPTVLTRAAESKSLVDTVKQDTGLDLRLTLGQATGSPQALGIQDVIAKHPETIGAQRVYGVQQLHTLGAFRDKTIDAAFESGRVGSKEASDRAAAAHNSYLERLDQGRDSQANFDFTTVRRLAKNEAVLPLKQTMAAIDELEKRARGWGPKEARASSDYLASIREDLVKITGASWASIKSGAPVARADEFNKSLQQWGRSARTGDSAADKLDRSETAKIAAAIFGAMQRDMDDAIEAGGKSGAVAQALRAARDNFKRNSGKIDAARADTITRLLGMVEDQQGELIPKRLLAKTPEEIRTTMGILAEAEPAAAKAVQGSALEELLRKAVVITGADNPDDTLASAAKIRTALIDNQDKLQALLYDRPQVVNKLAMLTQFARKIADRGEVAGSPTADRLDIQRAIGAGETGKLAQQELQTFLERPASASTARVTNWVLTHLLRVMRSPEGMQNIINDPHVIDEIISVMNPRSNLGVKELGRVATHVLALQPRDYAMIPNEPAEFNYE